MSKPNNYKPIDIGFALKSTREDLDLSQKKVMELTGINNKTLSGYENNISEPDINTLILLAQTYNTTLDKLLMCNYNLTKETELQKDIKLFERYFSVLPKNVRDDLLLQVSALYKKYSK